VTFTVFRVFPSDSTRIDVEQGTGGEVVVEQRREWSA